MRGQNKNLKDFFNPRSIAIVGATDGIGKVGTVITRNVLNLGYPGEAYLVNPKRSELFGKKCYASLADIKQPVDLAVVVVPAGIAVRVIKEAPLEIKNYAIISAGFSEIGGEGLAREKELKEICEKKQLNILGPNCLGFINPFQKINATFSGGMPRRGNIALVSQSGALAVAIMDMFRPARLGFSGVFSIGNKMQIDEVDLAEYLASDENTKAVGLYLEGISDGRRFLKTISRISKKKPVVVLKAGKTEKSRQAISSHTGALAGSDKIAQAVLKKAGAVRADSSRQFLNLLKICSLAKSPVNEKVILLTNAGGAGVLAADAFLGKEITLAEFSPETKANLKKILPEESSVKNPVDLLGDAGKDRYQKALEIIDWESAGSVICVLTPQEQTPVEDIAGIIAAFSRRTGKSVITCFSGGERVGRAGELLDSAGICNFTFSEEAVEALDKYCRWKLSGKKILVESGHIDPERRKKALGAISQAKARQQKILKFNEAKKIFSLYSINAIKSWTEMSAANLEFPVAVKIDSGTVLHKTDKEGVILDVKNKTELVRAIEKLKNYFPGEKIVIQPMLEGGVELILGVKRDAVFGPVVVYGLGGIYAEILGQVEILIPPLHRGEICEALSSGPLSFLFRETRGKKPYDRHNLVEMIYNLCELARENPEINELDINPLFLYNDSREALAADIKIII